MSLPDYKALKKLADNCRKVGIKSFKNADFEVTFSEDAPISSYKKRQASKSTMPAIDSNDVIENYDTLTDEQMLYWSLNETPESTPPEQIGD